MHVGCLLRLFQMNLKIPMHQVIAYAHVEKDRDSLNECLKPNTKIIKSVFKTSMTMRLAGQAFWPHRDSRTYCSARPL